MDKKQLESMRQEANTLFKGTEREIALKAIEELEAGYKDLNEGIKIHPGPAVREIEHAGFFQALKNFLIFKFGSKSDRDKLIQEEISFRKAEDFLIQSIARDLKKPAYKKKIKSAFRKRKYIFRLSSLFLLFSMFYLIPTIISFGVRHEVTIFIVMLWFLGGYLYLEHKIWRCPACNYKFDVSSKFKNGRLNSSSLKRCPRCHAPFK